jgi:hypothetical protein
MRITSGGDVGINATTVSQPSSGATTLRIVGTSTTKGGAIYLDSSDSSVSSYIYPDNTNGLSINTATSHPIVLRTAGTERMRITSGGNVLIGTATDNTGKLQVSGAVYATGGFYESSDSRLKNIIERNPNVSLDIDLVKYERKDSSGVRYGYIAQEVQSIIPELASGKEFLSLNYQDIHSIKIAALERKIKELESKLAN